MKDAVKTRFWYASNKCGELRIHYRIHVEGTSTTQDHAWSAAVPYTFLGLRWAVRRAKYKLMQELRRRGRVSRAMDAARDVADRALMRPL